MEHKKPEIEKPTSLWWLALCAVLVIVFFTSVNYMGTHLFEVHAEINKIDDKIEDAAAYQERMQSKEEIKAMTVGITVAEWSMKLEDEPKSPERDAVAKEIVKATEDTNISIDEYKTIKRALIKLNEAKHIAEIKSNLEALTAKSEGQL